MPAQTPVDLPGNQQSSPPDWFGQLNGRLWALVRRGMRPLSRSPWWVRIGVLYLASRIVSTTIFLAAAIQQGPNPWSGSSPSYLEFIGIWDSDWYQTIFTQGYPSELPREADGTVQQNPWAFYPLFPLVVRSIASLTGGDWAVLASVVSILSGLAASLVIYRLFRLYATTITATWAVAFVLFFPISPILQVPYAESLNLAFLAAALLMICKHRYLLAVPLVLLADLSRPIGAAFLLFFVLHCLSRLLWRRSNDKIRSGITGVGSRIRAIPVWQRFAALILLVISFAGAVAWPLIAWWVTGDFDGYTATETSWRGGPLVLFESWFATAETLFGPIIAPVTILALIIAFILYLNSASVRSIGMDLRLWCASYALYLFAVLHPQTSTFRLLLPLFPFALAAAALSRSRAYRGALVVFFVLLQIVWVVWLWAWAPLPGGGDYPP